MKATFTFNLNDREDVDRYEIFNNAEKNHDKIEGLYDDLIRPARKHEVYPENFKQFGELTDRDHNIAYEAFQSVLDYIHQENFKRDANNKHECPNCDNLNKANDFLNGRIHLLASDIEQKTKNYAEYREHVISMLGENKAKMVILENTKDRLLNAIEKEREAKDILSLRYNKIKQNFIGGILIKFLFRGE